MEPGLPYPCTVAEDFTLEAEVGGQECRLEPGAVVVPKLRWRAIRLQLLDCAEYRETIRQVVREHDAVWRVVLAGALEAQRARLALEQVGALAARSADWSPWEVYLAVGIGAAAGIAAGIVVGVLLALAG